MVNDILSKLETELQQEITSERQVVYILVQIRKLINTVELEKDFEALKLHCDWVVHTTLSRRSAKELLSQLNDAYSERLSKNRPEKAVMEVGEKLGLQAFRRDFHRLLQLYGLDDSVCDGNWWFAFLYYYSCVIQDCPLEGQADSGWAFDRVVLVDPDLTVSPERLYLQWEFLLGEQQVGLWTIHHNRESLGGVKSTGPSVRRQFNWKKGLNRILTGVVAGLVLERIWRRFANKK